jgi:putative ABC transport system substrate-binding protein
MQLEVVTRGFALLGESFLFLRKRGMEMKKVLSILLVLGLVLTGCNSSSKKDKKDVKIAVLQYMPHAALDAAYKGFKDKLVKEGYSAKNITLKNAQGEISNCETIAEQMVNESPDLIYAIATPAAQTIAKKTKDIPVVVSAVTDPETSKLVKSNKKPGNNITGTSDLTPVKDQIKLLKSLLPNAKEVAVLYTGSESNSEIQAKIAVKEAKANGLNVVEKTVSDSNDIDAVARSIKSDVVYIPTDNLLAANVPTVTQALNENNIPLICGEEAMVKNGGLATYGIDYYKLGQKSGEMAVKILKGATPATMPIEYLDSNDCQLTINKTQVSRFKVSVPADLEKKANYVTTNKQ